jgi:hypothetical protein
MSLTACPHGDVFPEITFNERTYSPIAEAVIPPSDLTAVGQAEGTPGDLVTDLTVFAITGVDASAVIALPVDPARWADLVGQRAPELVPETPPTHVLFWGASAVNPDVGMPEAVCAYVDPRSAGAPSACQALITVTIGGRTYVSVPESSSSKALPVSLTVAAGDLEPVGNAEDVDPRLLPIEPTVYALPRIDPALVVLMRRDADPRYLVFLEASQHTVPPAFCDFIDPDPDIPELGALLGCP